MPNPVRQVTGLLLLAIASPLGAEGTWRAGHAAVKITPQQTMWMSGYASRERPAEGKLTDLWAKALVLEDAEGKRGLLLTLDLVGIDRALSNTVRDQITNRFGLARKSIAICCSHTHTGPVVAQNLRPMHYALLSAEQQRVVDQYAQRLQSRVSEIVAQAIGSLAPCQLQHGMGTAGFAVNRRNNVPEVEVPARRAAGTLLGPHDHDVPVLTVRDVEGKLKTVVFGYACHATVLSFYQWSGDYPGFAQQELERLHPGCQAMFWAGCGGDQNPLPRRTAELAEHYGRSLANAVDAVLLTSQMTEISPELETSYAEIDLRLDTLPSLESLQAASTASDRFNQARARVLLNQIELGQALAQTYPFPVAVWKLGGDVRWILLGGEVVVDYALRFKRELHGPVWVAAYTNDVMAYIPSRRVLREGGYEGASSMVYYGLPTTWDPTIEEAIVSEVHRQVGEGE